MRKGRLASWGVIVLLLCFGLITGLSSTFFAQSIEVKSHGGIPYMSGGIGLDEREEMEALGQSYNLKLLFAVQQGNYLSEVKVAITDASGKLVLEAVSDGPWFYAELPAGSYQVSATTLGKTISKSARVGSGARSQLNFVWTNW